MRPIILLALLAIACDTPPVEGPPGPAGPKGDPGAVGPVGPAGGSTVRSGTRLKAIVYRSEDGASQFLGWWDSELDFECSFSQLGEERRCVPSAPSAVYFFDRDCTDGPYAVFGGDAPPFLRTRDNYVEIGREESPVAERTLLYTLVGPYCQSAYEANAGNRVVSPGPEVPPGTFSLATRHIEG